jgi:hypothetical protein
LGLLEKARNEREKEKARNERETEKECEKEKGEGESQGGMDGFYCDVIVLTS